MKTEYKGYTIQQDATGMHFVMDGNRPDVDFNTDGYKTMNAAKGAITKAVNAANTLPEATPAATPVSANPELDVKTAGTAKVKAATSDDTDKSRIDAFEDYTGPDAGEVRIPLFNTENLMAGMRYLGFIKANGKPRNSDKRSRNKREGGYAGKAKAQTIAGRKIKPYHHRRKTNTLRHKTSNK